MSYDVIVIGGSFAGQSAAMQLARARRKVLVVDGGKPRNRFAETSHGFLGQDGRTPAAIIGEASRQLAAYPTVTQIKGEAVLACRDNDRFSIGIADGRQMLAARVVLATGVRDELPDIAGIEERWGKTVLHCPYCHGYEVADRPLGVLARSPMSVHQAQLIPDWGPTFYFTQGRFEPDAEQAALLAARGVTIVRSPVVELRGNAPDLETVLLEDGTIVPLGALFVAPKTHIASPLAEQLGCAIDDGPTGPIVRVDSLQRTTVAGVFAAGDAAMPMANATLASAAGVMAGVAAHRSMFMPD
ncbi:thioredoxin reductase [Rhizobium sp. Root1203]|uniref:NAD(P)/FAD-dependent oxidoreductase n=1 Tax=Rhizobium sp. Root1203 TaxID=1736427 RepID=UPI00070FCF71|nr:NAD(P)/FAD-dependent oxidoreductase [Rhizobium sp. Root1203]KQV32663.1 thioredoxin reductase [Rhizobium sp. Root1203]